MVSIRIALPWLLSTLLTMPALAEISIGVPEPLTEVKHRDSRTC